MPETYVHAAAEIAAEQMCKHPHGAFALHGDPFMGIIA